MNPPLVVAVVESHAASKVEPQEAIFTIPVLLFASLKEAAGSDHITVEITDIVTNAVSVHDFLMKCGQQYPMIAAWLPHVRVAVNHEYAGTQQLIQAGDEVALLPPVSGGASLVGAGDIYSQF